MMWPDSQWLEYKPELIEYLNQKEMIGSNRSVGVKEIYRMPSMTADPEDETYHLVLMNEKRLLMKAKEFTQEIEGWVPNSWMIEMTCMWCAKRFQTIQELEDHEDNCA